MRRATVISSTLGSVGYDGSQSTLEIEFHGGRVYQYFGVPRELYEGLMAAASHGRYFNAHIKKGGYAFIRVR